MLVHDGRDKSRPYDPRGGRRYDGLAGELGYPSTPGVGFGLGVDRTLEMVAEEGESIVSPPVVLLGAA